MTYRMHQHEADELMLTISGFIDDDEARQDPSGVAERECEARYGCDIEAFLAIAQDLLPLAVIAKGGVSGNAYQGFAKDNRFIVKREISKGA